MSVSPADFHAFALRIAKSATHEIDFRNVVSRTYYAAFHAALRRYAERDHGFDIRIGHSEFSQWLLNRPAGSKDRALGIALNFLRQHRNTADYALDRPVIEADTRTAFGAYGNVMRMLDSA